MNPAWVRDGSMNEAQLIITAIYGCLARIEHDLQSQSIFLPKTHGKREGFKPPKYGL